MRTMVPQRDRPLGPIPSSRRCSRRRRRPSRLANPPGLVRRRRRHVAHPFRPGFVCRCYRLAARTCHRRSAVIARVDAGKKDKGLTLEEVETAEGGVVRESAVGMAQTKRAARRKGKQAAAVGALPAARVCAVSCSAAAGPILLGHGNAANVETVFRIPGDVGRTLDETMLCAAHLDSP